ncbi:MAG: tetratricopeptide repeat protein, partial [Saprospiraceae bacterium]
MVIIDEINKIPPESMVILCGAGVSYDSPTKLPTVNRFIRSVIAGTAGEKSPLVTKVLKCKYKPRFEVVVDEIIKFHDGDSHIANVFSSNRFNVNHAYIANLLIRGATVITTNFDCCIENALGIQRYNRYVFDGTDVAINSFGHCLIKPHGSVSEDSDKKGLVISISALARLNNGFLNFPGWRTSLLGALKGKYLIVLGYSGSDDFDLTPVILKSGFLKCFWILHDSKSLSPIIYSKDIVESKLLNRLEKVCIVQFNTSLFLESISGEYMVSIDKTTDDGMKSLDSYVDSICSTSLSKTELLSTILYNYQLYQEVLNLSVESSIILRFNEIRSLFRLGEHKKLVDIVGSIAFDKTEYKFLKSLLHIYSTSLFYVGLFDDSLRTAEQLLSLAIEKEDIETQMISFYHFGALNFNLNDYDLAESYYNRSLSLQSVSPSIEPAANSHWGLGDIYLTRKKYNEAEASYKEALALHESLSSVFGIANLKHNLGLLYFLKGELDTSEPFIDSAERLFKGLMLEGNVTSGSQGLIYATLTYSKLYFARKDFYSFRVKIEESFRQLVNCVGHPNFHEIISTYFYSILKFEGFERFSTVRENVLGSSLQHTIESRYTINEWAKTMVNTFLGLNDESQMLKSISEFESN